MNNETPADSSLARRFGLPTATFVVVASMVGSGILLSPGFMMLTLGSFPLIFAIWIVGGLLALCGALTVAELAASMPHAGGEYVYLREAYGPLPAFLSGWTSFVLGFSAPLAVNSQVCASYILAGVQPKDAANPQTVRFLAAGIIVTLTVPHLFGHRPTAWTQGVTTVLKLALLTGFVLLTLMLGNGNWDHVTSRPSGTNAGLSVMATQLFYVMFAYTGWNASTYLAGEIRSPGRLLPLSLILGVVLVMLLYLGINLAIAYALPINGITSFDEAPRVALVAAEAAFGPYVSRAFSAAVGLTFLASVSAYILTGPRVYYAMACDRLFPSFAARLSKTTKVPRAAMLAQSVLAVALLFASGLESLYKYAAVGLSLFTMLIVAAVFLLRWRRPEMERPFRIPGYPLTPTLFLVITLVSTYCAFSEWPQESIIALATILAGIPAYYIWRWASNYVSTRRN